MRVVLSYGIQHQLQILCKVCTFLEQLFLCRILELFYQFGVFFQCVLMTLYILFVELIFPRRTSQVQVFVKTINVANQQPTD